MTDDGIVMLLSDEQNAKQLSSNDVTDGGIVMLSSDKQPQKQA